MKVFLCSLLVLWSVVWCWVLVVLVLNFSMEGVLSKVLACTAQASRQFDPIATLHTLVISVSVPVRYSCTMVAVQICEL